MNILFVSDILLITVTIIWLIAASIIDIRKREVPNWISFSLIAIALAVRAIAAILVKQPTYFIYGLAGFVIFLLIANLFYYSKTFGGGDAKLLMALGAALATSPFFAKQNTLTILNMVNEPFLLGFIVNIFFVGAVYGMGAAIILSIKNKKQFSKEFKKTNRRILFLTIPLWACAVFFLVMGFLVNLFFILSAIFFIIPLVFLFAKAVENSSMIRKVPTSRLAEGDWIVNPVRVKGKTIKPNVHGLNSKEIQLLRKHKKQVTIKIGLPFVPSFLIALIISLFVGDLLLIIIKTLVSAL